jgi:hypothetical protein
MAPSNRKIVEIRDRMTFVPALAVRLEPTSERERYLLAAGGFGIEAVEQAGYVLLTKLVSSRSAWDPFDWGDRTMTTAHAYLIEHWASVETGQVIDVEFILGETEAPKTPEGEAGPDVAF